MSGKESTDENAKENRQSNKEDSEIGLSVVKIAPDSSDDDDDDDEPLMPLTRKTKYPLDDDSDDDDSDEEDKINQDENTKISETKEEPYDSDAESNIDPKPLKLKDSDDDDDDEEENDTSSQPAVLPRRTTRSKWSITTEDDDDDDDDSVVVEPDILSEIVVQNDKEPNKTIDNLNSEQEAYGENSQIGEEDKKSEQIELKDDKQEEMSQQIELEGDKQEVKSTVICDDFQEPTIDDSPTSSKCSLVEILEEQIQKWYDEDGLTRPKKSPKSYFEEILKNGVDISDYELDESEKTLLANQIERMKKMTMDDLICEINKE